MLLEFDTKVRKVFDEVKVEFEIEVEIDIEVEVEDCRL